MATQTSYTWRYTDSSSLEDDGNPCRTRDRPIRTHYYWNIPQGLLNVAPLKQGEGPPFCQRCFFHAYRELAPVLGLRENENLALTTFSDDEEGGKRECLCTSGGGPCDLCITAWGSLGRPGT
jgi:hypothetical protein